MILAYIYAGQIDKGCQRTAHLTMHSLRQACAKLAKLALSLRCSEFAYFTKQVQSDFN